MNVTNRIEFKLHPYHPSYRQYILASISSNTEKANVQVNIVDIKPFSGAIAD